jgi:hypothetical protein
MGKKELGIEKKEFICPAKKKTRGRKSVDEKYQQARAFDVIEDEAPKPKNDPPVASELHEDPAVGNTENENSPAGKPEERSDIEGDAKSVNYESIGPNKKGKPVENKPVSEKDYNKKRKDVEKSAEAFGADIFGEDNAYLKKILRRWPRGKNLKDDEIAALTQDIAASRDEIISNVSEKVYIDLKNPEIGSRYPEERKGLFFQDIVDNRVFKEMRSAIFSIAEDYIKSKKINGIPVEKDAKGPTKNESIYSGEKAEAFLHLLLQAGGYFRKLVKDSEKWGDEFGVENARKKSILEQLQIALIGVIAKDPKLKKHFTEENAPGAIERVVNNIKFYNDIE